jgi:hypothetical protein
MSNYTAYPTKKDTPNRKNRKGERNKTFQYNKTLAKKLKKEARYARQSEQSA